MADSAPDASDRRRAAVAATAAVLVVAGTIIAILVTGGVNPPAFPSLAEDPDPAIPGLIAYTNPAGTDVDESCVRVVQAGGGQPRTLHCEEGLWANELRWGDRQQLVLHGHDGLGGVELTIDVEREEVVDRRRIPPGEPPPRPPAPTRTAERADGAYVVTGGAGRGGGNRARVVLVEPNGEERTLLAVDGPRGYHFTCAQFSPDGDWVVVCDDADRLLIVDAHRGGARLLAEEAANPAWQPAP